MKTPLAVSVTLLVASLVALASAAGPPEPVLDPQRVTWKRLEFKAKKLFLTARSRVELRSVSASEAAAHWISAARGHGVRPTGADVLQVTVESSGIGSGSTESVWLDPRRGDAVQRLKTKHGKKGYRKSARFTDEGVFVLRTAPADKAEGELPFAQWSKIEEFFYPRPDGDGCRALSEPAALFYMLSAQGGEALHDVCLFSNKQVVPIAVTTLGEQRLEVDYAEIRRDETRRRHEAVDALRVAVRPLGEGELELMGLEGDVEILLDERSRVPLEVCGKIGGLGRVRIKLTAVELR